MAGETILIVEDAPEALKFTAGVLRSEGYKVQIASTAEQALSTLRFLQPNLLLVDFMLPGMNGLELVGRVKQDARLQKTVIVALTACAMPGDEARARQAGCDGYLTKPIEARALTARIRQYLDHGGSVPAGEAAAQSSAGSLVGLPQSEVTELRDSFLKGGKGLSRQFLVSLEGQFDDAKARRTVHQWIGTAGLLGFSTISQRAREAEDVLRTPPWNASRLRGPLTALARAFNNPSAPLSEPPSAAAVRVLQGKRVALIGLSEDEADRMCTALEQVGARARLFEAEQTPYAEAVGMCHLVVVHVRPANALCRWLAREAPGLPTLPTIFLGAPEHLVELTPAVQARAGALLAEGCLVDETLMRLRLAVTQPLSTAAAGSAAARASW
jgi:CheY-like chemotaxis protein/HPt (histidine-containing phosphotransfer) domain-containing protein